MNRTLQRLKSHDYGAILEDLGIIRAGMVIFPEKRRLAAYRIPGVPAGMLFFPVPTNMKNPGIEIRGFCHAEFRCAVPDYFPLRSACRVEPPSSTMLW